MQLHVNMQDKQKPNICNFCGDNQMSRVPASIYKVENWIQSCQQKRCPEPRMTRTCSAPTSKKSKKRLKSKSKGSVASEKSGKSVTFSNFQVGTTLKSTSMVQPCIHRTHATNFPIQLTTHLTRIDRPKKPDRTCSCISNAVTNRETCLTSHQLMSQLNPYPIQQVAQRVSNTRLLLSGLKSEINKVKSQLTNISLEATKSNASSPNSQVDKEISELKFQNIKLKKDLDLKRQQCSESLKEVENAKRILNDYEKKVLSLHDQAMKSSKLIKQSKERFCKCLKEKEMEIEQLKQNNHNLIESVREQDMKFKKMDSEYENLRSSFTEETSKLTTLSENNKNFTQCVQLLEKQLDNAVNEAERYKDDVRKLEQQILNYECKLCQKLEVKVKKQKIKLNNKIKEQEETEHRLMNQIAELSSQLEATKEIQISHENLQNKYKDLEDQLQIHENFVNKYKMLDQKYREDCNAFQQKEENYEKDRQQLRNLVSELTMVVKQNKVTLLQLSAINKHQEHLLLSQTSIITEKDDKINLVESEIEMLRKQSLELQEEVESLRKSLEEPCKHESHLALIDELREIRKSLNEEIDNKLVKEKIIEDQSKTITILQKEITEKVSELNQAREESSVAEEEIMMVNEDLLRVHKKLDEEIDKKETLHQKCEELQIQNSTLSIEITELENLVQKKLGSDQRMEIEKLQQEIILLKRNCETEKAKLRMEKEKAVEAAQFATQKLLDTVNDFQRQVGAQKKVQCLLTKMLHDKEDDLRTVHKRLNSINSLTTGLESKFPIDEIFKSHQIDVTDPYTTSSYMSSCSHCSREHSRTSPRYKNKETYNIYVSDEEPIRD